MTDKNTFDLSEIERIAGYSFRDQMLPRTALTHSSFANENNVQSYERIEFLGDAILGFTVAEYLYSNDRSREGELTRMRAALVCEANLAEAARKLGIGKLILLGRGEEAAHGRERASLLCDVMEAIIGAIYLDGGIEPAKAFIMKNILCEPRAARSERTADYKTVLQELVQRDGVSTLTYRMIGESGPDHAKRFTAEALINGKSSGVGEGRSKKEAEQAAARDAYEKLGKAAGK